MDYQVGAYGENASGQDQDDAGNQYTPQIQGDNLLHFVFGINLTRDNQGAVQPEKIYVSTLKNRSKKVYNEKHQVVGEVQNTVEETISSYGTQTYRRIT